MGNCASGGPGPVSHVEHAHRIVGHLQTAAVQADASAAQLAAHGAAVREAGGPFKKLEAAVAALLGAASGHASHGRPSRPAVAQPAAVEELLIARGPVPVHRVEELLDALALAYAAYPLPPKPSSKHSKPPKQLSEAEARQAVAKSAAKHGYGHLRPEDLLLVTTKAEVYEPAFYVAVDAARHRIVWCVRGTDSPADALTDLIADPEPLPGYPGAVAHGGMLRAALFVLKAGGPAVAAALAAHPGFSLFLTGHSLGAGTAALLCLLLRGNAQLLAVLGVKNAELVSAIVFCTPMALDYKSATALDRAAGGLPYLTSVIHAADPVPRLSAGTAGAAVSSAFHHLLPVRGCCWVASFVGELSWPGPASRLTPTSTIVL